MAEKHEIVELGNVNGDGRGAMFLAESSSVARRRRFVALMKALFGLSKKGTVLPPKPSERSAAASSSLSVCSSTRIERIMRSRTRFATEVDLEIEASKDHWSELEQRSEESSSDVEDERVHLTNAEIMTNAETVESLRNQFPQICDFFRDSTGFVEVGEKIAEGGQAEIFTAKLIDSGYDDYSFVLKVFKEGSSMRDLQKQWPLGMLNLERGGWMYILRTVLSYGVER